MNGIYQYRDLKTDMVVYIGKDSNIDKNVRHHAHMKPSTYNRQPFNQVLQNNPDRYQYEIIYAGNYDNAMLNTLEINSIAEHELTYGNLPKFNFTTGGDGGFIVSDETRKKTI